VTDLFDDPCAVAQHPIQAINVDFGGLDCRLVIIGRNRPAGTQPGARPCRGRIVDTRALAREEHIRNGQTPIIKNSARKSSRGINEPPARSAAEAAPAVKARPPAGHVALCLLARKCRHQGI
jgi:hypothetical protein